jgi:hypothetical protein
VIGGSARPVRCASAIRSQRRRIRFEAGRERASKSEVVMPNMAELYGRTRRALLNKPGVLFAADHRAPAYWVT